jgi:hypothetical protein
LAVRALLKKFRRQKLDPDLKDEGGKRNARNTSYIISVSGSIDSRWRR